MAEESIGQEVRLKSINETRNYFVKEIKQNELMKKCKSIIKKKKKKHNKIVLIAKTKINSIEVLISKPLIDSNFSHDEFALKNSELKEYDDMEEEIKNLSS